VQAAEYCPSGQRQDNAAEDLEANQMNDKTLWNPSGSEGPVSSRGRLPEPEEERLKRPRSAVTSGRKLLLQGDVNGAWARRYRDVMAGLTSDLGGRNMVGEAKAAMVRDCAAIEIALEKMRGRMSEGQHVDIQLYARVANQRRRLLESIGLERVARDVTPMTLDNYLQAKAAQKFEVESQAGPRTNLPAQRTNGEAKRGKEPNGIG
jgi:hypothetical protein